MRVVFCEGEHFFDATRAQLKIVKEEIGKGKKQYLVVPDRFSLEMEKMVMQELGVTASFDFEVLTMTRLANLVIQNFGNKKLLSRLDATLLLKFLLVQYKDQLKFFTGTAITVGFAGVLFDTIAQMKSCNITPTELKNSAARLKNPALRQKLEDIALVFEGYEKFLSDQFVDTNSRMGLLCEKLPGTKVFENSGVHFCHFPDFTPQGFRALAQLFKVAPLVTVGMINSGTENQTRAALYEICRETQVTPQVIAAPSSLTPWSRHILSGLFSPKQAAIEIKGGAVQLYSASGVREEVEFVAKLLRSLIRKGARFRDICINCSDFANYKNTIRQVFARYQIPLWLDEPFDLQRTEGFKLLESAFSVIKWNWAREDVLRFALNGLSPLSTAEKDCCESCASKFGVEHTMWQQPLRLKFENPDFIKFEQIKAQITLPLKNFAAGVEKSITVADFCQATLGLMTELDIQQKMEEQSLEFEREGWLEKSSVQRQSYQKLTNILERMQGIIGEQPATFAEFVEIFQSGVAATTISPLPMSLDCVFVGQMLSSVFVPNDFYFVLGAVEGKLPAWLDDTGILSDSEIGALEQIHLTPTIFELNQRTRQTVAQNLALARHRLVVTFPTTIANQQNEQSQVLTSLQNLFRWQEEKLPVVNCALAAGDSSSFVDARSRLLFNWVVEDNLLLYIAANKEGALSDLAIAVLQAQGRESEIQPLLAPMKTAQLSNADKIFFAADFIKVTQLERFFSCPFKHFIDYGLKLTEKEQSKLQPVDIGNILHAVVEKFCNSGKGKILSEEEVNSLASSIFEKVIAQTEYEHLLFGVQNRALAMGLRSESMRVCRAINHQNSHSRYQVAFTESSLGDLGFAPMPEITIVSKGRTMRLRGKMDRVDLWGKRFRVVDYKTGRSSSQFSILDLYLGTKIQLFVYLWALQQSWLERQPSGAFYFPLHNEYGDSEPILPYENFGMDGVTVGEMPNLLAQDDQVSFDCPKSGIIKFTLKRNKEVVAAGSFEAREDELLVSQAQFNAMTEYSRAVLAKGVEEILDGFIEPKPLPRSCAFCSVRSFCPHYKKEFPDFRVDKFEVTKDSFLEVENDRT